MVTTTITIFVIIIMFIVYFDSRKSKAMKSLKEKTEPQEDTAVDVLLKNKIRSIRLEMVMGGGGPFYNIKVLEKMKNDLKQIIATNNINKSTTTFATYTLAEVMRILELEKQKEIDL